MNTQENNRLIAEFMEYPELGTEGDFSYLKYHTSWDWLMPVVEKISQIEDDDFDMQIYNRYEYITKLPITGSRELIYKAVVEFIKWYNKKEE